MNIYLKTKNIIYNHKILKSIIFEKWNLLERDITFSQLVNLIRNKFNFILKLLVFSFVRILYSFLITLLIIVHAFALFFFFYQIAGYAGPRGISPKGEKGKSGPRGLNIFLNNIIMRTIIYKPYIIIVCL